MQLYLKLSPVCRRQVHQYLCDHVIRTARRVLWFVGGNFHIVSVRFLRHCTRIERVSRFEKLLKNRLSRPVQRSLNQGIIGNLHVDKFASQPRSKRPSLRTLHVMVQTNLSVNRGNCSYFMVPISIALN